jgi:hypothetical protein
MAENLPMHANVAQSKHITQVVDRALNQASALLGANLAALVGPVRDRATTMAARRWAARNDPDPMPAATLPDLSDGALQSLMQAITEELEIRGYLVTYGIGGPVAQGTAAGIGGEGQAL